MASWTSSEPGAMRADSSMLSMLGWGSGAVEVDILGVVEEDKSARMIEAPVTSYIAICLNCLNCLKCNGGREICYWPARNEFINQ